MKKIVGVVGSGILGRDPFDEYCWSCAGYSFFTTSQQHNFLARAFGVEVPSPVRELIAAKRFSLDRQKWKSKFYLDPLYYELLTREVRKNIRQEDYEHNFLQIGAIYDVPSIVKNKSKVFSFHDSNIAELARSPFFSKHLTKFVNKAFAWEKKVYEKMDIIFTYSEFLRQSFINDFNIPGHKVVVVCTGPNFPVPETIGSKDYSKKEILFIGKNFQRKGGNTLVKAFEKIYSKHPDSKLHIVGPKVVPSIVKNTQCPGIVFHGFLSKEDPVQNKTIQQLLNQCTISVLPSLYEPLGCALLECMSFGMPAIAPNRWSFAEFISDEETGKFIKIEDPISLAEAFDYYLSDSDIRKAHGTNARRFITKEYTWDNVITKMKAAILKSENA